MRLFYNDYSLNRTTKRCDEIESFFDALKLIDNFSVNEMSELFNKKKSDFPKQNKQSAASKNDYSSVLFQKGIDSLSYENITVEQVKTLESDEGFTKTLALQLANSIGISKKSYKSRKEIFQDIYRMINNRDTLNATKNILTNEPGKENT